MVYPILLFHWAILLNNFTMITKNYCIYVKWSKTSFILLSLYFDDILMARNYKGMIITTKQWLSLHFEMKNMGEVEYILGVKIYKDHSKKLLCLSQQTYVRKVLERFQMNDCKLLTPILLNEKAYCKICVPRLQEK